MNLRLLDTQASLISLSFCYLHHIPFGGEPKQQGKEQTAFCYQMPQPPTAYTNLAFLVEHLLSISLTETNNLSIYLSICLSVCLSIYLSIHMCVCACACVCMHVCVCVCVRCRNPILHIHRPTPKEHLYTDKACYKIHKSFQPSQTHIHGSTCTHV